MSYQWPDLEPEERARLFQDRHDEYWGESDVVTQERASSLAAMRDGHDDRRFIAGSSVDETQIPDRWDLQ